MSARGKKLRGLLPKFLREYARTSRRGGFDPNDRRYDRKVERIVKRLPADQLDDLIHDGRAEPETRDFSPAVSSAAPQRLAAELLGGALGPVIQLRARDGASAARCVFVAPGHVRCTLPTESASPTPFNMLAALRAARLDPQPSGDVALVVDLRTEEDVFAVFKIACNQLGIDNLDQLLLEAVPQLR